MKGVEKDIPESVCDKREFGSVEELKGCVAGDPFTGTPMFSLKSACLHALTQRDA